MEQLSLPMGPQALVSLDEAWPWHLLAHAEGMADDVPALARAWAAGRRDGDYDLGDALVADGRVSDAGLALVAALGPVLDAPGAQGQFARTWSVRLLAQARRRLGGQQWGVDALLGLLHAPDELQRRVVEAVVPLLPTVRALHRRDLAMPAKRRAQAERWGQALDLLTLEGWTGAATALDAGWPEDDLWEGLTCGDCGAALEAWVADAVEGMPCELALGLAGDPPHQAMHGDVGMLPAAQSARWEDDPGAWARWRLRGCDVPLLAERLAVRTSAPACPACGHVEALAHRAPGGRDPRGAQVLRD